MPACRIIAYSALPLPTFWLQARSVEWLEWVPYGALVPYSTRTVFHSSQQARATSEPYTLLVRLRRPTRSCTLLQRCTRRPDP